MVPPFPVPRSAKPKKGKGGDRQLNMHRSRAVNTRQHAQLPALKMSKSQKASMALYPAWSFFISINVPHELVLSGEQAKYIQAASLGLLEVVEAILASPRGGTDAPIEAVLLLQRPVVAGPVDFTQPMLEGPASAGQSARAATDIVSVVLIYGGKGRMKQVVERFLKSLIDKMQSLPETAREKTKQQCLLALRCHSVPSLIRDLEGCHIHHVRWAKHVVQDARRPLQLPEYLIARARAEKGAGPAGAVATADLHLLAGLDSLGPSKSAPAWTSSGGGGGGTSSTGGGTSIKRLAYVPHQEEGAKKARSAEGAQEGPVHTSPDPEPSSDPGHSNASSFESSALQQLLNWEGELTAPSLAERASELLTYIADITDDNVRLKLELQHYKAQDALRAKVNTIAIPDSRIAISIHVCVCMCMRRT